ncbi:uncharacterized protein BP01DRAFT_372031 [Aspergillus saccharolyticus JOP 1030-1]|uniref:FR47-like domain-containing protein n=1 Tax=Aspergillus saccharolyticus JOP 1030-1 TaxID=1450539 RepID=A0A318ZU57_9EURO|nr:hypothetical protein BP01DRAFT_372031 [Aspergillus saccharolyticus JOP 1030-1]PYH47853.1 hypothetical protein BP01DRAFT_372031 [Aspergillus saccharolyticus JOP 1030-1]
MSPSDSAESAPVDLDSWYPQYLRCTQYFLEQGQFSPAVQSLAAFLNIRLPCQRSPDPAAHVLLRRYIRRLVVTAHDSPEVLEAFFGAEWTGGVGGVVQQERQTYLFTAKSSGWAATKAAYDLSPDEQTPFLRPLRAPAEEELRLAESRWTQEEEPWLIAFVDLFAGRETQVVVYSSEEAVSSRNVPLPAQAQAQTEPLSNTSQCRGERFLSVLTPSSPLRMIEIRTQLLALFGYIKTHLLPSYTAHLARSGPVLGATDHQLAPPPPHSFLIGNLHTGVFSTASGAASPSTSAPPSAPSSAPEISPFISGLKVHRYDRSPYVKYLFDGQLVRGDDTFSATTTSTATTAAAAAAAAAAPTPTPTTTTTARTPPNPTSHPPGNQDHSSPQIPPLHFRFHTHDGKHGVQPDHFALVRSRTVIPRSDATLAMLPGAAVYVHRPSDPDPGPRGVGEGEGEGESASGGIRTPETPVAWAFLGPDGSLATLHVEAEYRGRGLAGMVAHEAMRRGMVVDGRWSGNDSLNGQNGDGGSDSQHQGLVHTNVAMENKASRRVMEKLGGRLGWTVTWTVVEV